MVVSERKTTASTIRIHDEFFTNPTSGRISHLSQIVSDSYKRRAMAPEMAVSAPFVSCDDSMLKSLSRQALG